jgi:hypothetical protein
MKKNILFICGSLNQTMQMHAIAQEFPEYSCYFTPYYIGDFRDDVVKSLFDCSILGGAYRRQTEAYLAAHSLSVDEKGMAHSYDLVFTCQDIIVPANIRHKKIFLVQEGMTDREGLRFHTMKKLGLPRWFAGTASTGLSDAYRLFFVASEGYRALFITKGVLPEKLRVTGIPNFDNAEEYLTSEFPYSAYVLAVTSNLREVLEFENRKQFILKARDIAGNRQLIFKLHPGENINRATREIHRYAPGALIFSTGNTNTMVAHCDALVTRRSSVMYIAFALGKKVYADIPEEEIKSMMPIQNNGTSAQRIAATTKEYLESIPGEFYMLYHSTYTHKVCNFEQPYTVPTYMGIY